MECLSHKVCYISEEEAQEALIQAHVKFMHGPINFYLCNNCGSYHLTSKGERNNELDSEATKDRIIKERKALSWEERLKSR
jgi:hypothetical protein